MPFFSSKSGARSSGPSSGGGAGASGGSSGGAGKISGLFRALSEGTQKCTLAFDLLTKSSTALTKSFDSLGAASMRNASTSLQRLTTGSGLASAAFNGLGRVVLGSATPALAEFGQQLAESGQAMGDVNAAILPLPYSLAKFGAGIKDGGAALLGLAASSKAAAQMAPAIAVATSGLTALAIALAVPIAGLTALAVALGKFGSFDPKALLTDLLAKAAGVPAQVKGGAASAAPHVLKKLALAYFSEPTMGVAAAKVAAGGLIGGKFGGELADSGSHAIKEHLVKHAARHVAHDLGKGNRLSRLAGLGIRGAVGTHDVVSTLGASGLENFGTGYLQATSGPRLGSRGALKMAMGGGKMAMGSVKMGIHGAVHGLMAGMGVPAAGGAAIGGLAKLVGPEMQKMGKIAGIAAPVMAALTNTAAPMKDTFEKLGGAMTSLAVPISPMAGPVKALGEAFTGVHTQITDMTSNILQFVAANNPAAAEQFNRVMGDLMGTIGEALTPIITGLTPIIRMFADMLATIQPVIDALIKPVMDIVGIFAELLHPAFAVLVPIISALAVTVNEVKPIFKIIAELAEIILGVLAPMIQLVGTLLASLEPVLAILEIPLEYIVKGIKRVADDIISAINWLINQVNSLIDSWIGRRLGLRKIQTLDQLGHRSSVGKKVQESSFIGLEEYAKKTTMDALKSQNALSEDALAIIEAIHEIRDKMGNPDSPDDRAAAAAARPGIGGGGRAGGYGAPILGGMAVDGQHH